MLRLREMALLRQGQLSEPEASSGPAAMVLAIFRSLSIIRRRSPARTDVTSPAYVCSYRKRRPPRNRDSRLSLTHHT